MAGVHKQQKESKITDDAHIPARGPYAQKQGPVYTPGLSDSKAYAKMKGSAGSSGSQKGTK